MSDDRAGRRVGAVLEDLALHSARAGSAAAAPSGSGSEAWADADRQAEMGRQAEAGQRADDAADFTPVSLDSLRRVLDGLRELN
jgi:hypothetical protein